MGVSERHGTEAKAVNGHGGDYFIQMKWSPEESI